MAMRRFGVLLCGVVLMATARGGSGSDSREAPAKPDALQQVMSDGGYTCGSKADTEVSNFYGGVAGIPHRTLDCTKDGASGHAVRFFIWDDDVAREAFSSNAVDQFCGTDQSPTYVIGDGWSATVTKRNGSNDSTVIDSDGLSEVTDVVGGEVTSPFC